MQAYLVRAAERERGPEMGKSPNRTPAADWSWDLETFITREALAEALAPGGYRLIDVKRPEPSPSDDPVVQQKAVLSLLSYDALAFTLPEDAGDFRGRGSTGARSVRVQASLVTSAPGWARERALASLGAQRESIARDCYVEGLVRNPDLQGFALLDVSVDSGYLAPRSTQIAIADAGVARCLAEVLAGGSHAFASNLPGHAVYRLTFETFDPRVFRQPGDRVGLEVRTLADRSSQGTPPPDAEKIVAEAITPGAKRCCRKFLPVGEHLGGFLLRMTVSAEGAVVDATTQVGTGEADDCIAAVARGARLPASKARSATGWTVLVKVMDLEEPLGL